MGHLAITLRRVSWLACAFLLLSSAFASAGVSAVTADFDGDGRRDAVTLDLNEPSVLRMWLSATGTTSVIHSKVPVVCVVAVDLDGDHRPELIARDTSSALRVWTNKRKGFHRFRPRTTVPGTFAAPHHRSFDDGPFAPASELSWEGSASLAIVLTPQPRAPALLARRIASRVALPPVGIGRPLQSAPRSPPRLSL